MWICISIIFVVWGIVLVHVYCDNSFVTMGSIRGVPIKCERQAAFRIHTTTILRSAKMRTFLGRFPFDHTPIDHIHVVAVKMFNERTVGFIHCELYGIDSSCTCVTIRGDTTSTVQRILTPTYDMCMVVVNARPAVGGARPATFMFPPLESLVVSKCDAMNMGIAERMCAVVSDMHISIEAVAGMMDECKLSSAEQVIRECREETGEVIRQTDLTQASPPFATSHGLLDEHVTLWCGTQKHDNDEYVNTYLGNLQSGDLATHGNITEGECTLKALVPTNWLHLMGDAKLHAAQAYFLREGGL
jgi:hypothetical protein